MDMKQHEARVLCKPTTSSNFHNQATLLSLPREMRNEIYAYLLASGHLTILRSSRQLSVEALELIYTKAIFRMLVNSRQACHNNLPGVKISEKIQNLQLDWHLSDFICQRNANEVIDFCKKQQQMLRTCHVTLRFGRWQAALLTADDIAALRSLRVFRRVVLETMIAGSTQPTPKWHLAQVKSRILSMFKTLNDQLRLALGPAEQMGDVDARCLVFRPSRMSETWFQELPRSTTAYGW